ncbi:MAG TPA: hypothetical protein VF744_19900 [Beijerinckiaceae bacterium]|jgi:hypothetical protein
MSEKKAKTILRRKGGSIYPRINLEAAAQYAVKLVSKTHTGPQPENIILPGVFGSASDTGKIRASALKQYGLLEGKTDAYSATPLAKALVLAPENEKHKFLAEASRKPRVFNVLFNTFQSDEVSLARLRQQAASAGVHPDEAEKCARVFADSVTFAGLGTFSGETLALRAPVQESLPPSVEEETDDHQEDAGQIDEVDEETGKLEVRPEPKLDNPSARSVIHLNLSIDSSWILKNLKDSWPF